MSFTFILIIPVFLLAYNHESTYITLQGGAMIKTIFQQIEDIRLVRDQTYENLAAEIGITRATLYNILNGITAPNARTKYKIEKWLDGVTKEIPKKKAR
jgi:DNA-binding XRE family transcriptional regulator